MPDPVGGTVHVNPSTPHEESWTKNMQICERKICQNLKNVNVNAYNNAGYINLLYFSDKSSAIHNWSFSGF